MKLFALAVVVTLAAAPAMAAAPVSDSAASDSNAATVTPPQANPNVDDRTAAVDQSRQDYYKDKLGAANAQAKVDSAAADRDAAEDRAAEDKADARAAKDQ